MGFSPNLPPVRQVTRVLAEAHFSNLQFYHDLKVVAINQLPQLIEALRTFNKKCIVVYRLILLKTLNYVVEIMKIVRIFNVKNQS